MRRYALREVVPRAGDFRGSGLFRCTTELRYRIRGAQCRECGSWCIRPLHGHQRRAGSRRKTAVFSDCLGVSMIVLLTLYERLHIGSRDQPRLMPKRPGNPPPVMGRSAGFHRHNARFLCRKQLKQPRARYRFVETDDAIGFDAANLKTVLGKINRQYANLGHGRLPCFGSYKTTLAHLMPSGGGIHRISSNCRASGQKTGLAERAGKNHSPVPALFGRVESNSARRHKIHVVERQANCSGGKFTAFGGRKNFCV